MALGFTLCVSGPRISPWATSILFVKKKDQVLRFFIDYKELNNLLLGISFLFLILIFFLKKLRGASIFFKINLRFGHHQLRSEPSYVQILPVRLDMVIIIL